MCGPWATGPPAVLVRGVRLGFAHGNPAHFQVAGGNGEAEVGGVVLAVHEARVLERESSLLPLAAAAARHSSGRLVGPGEGGGGVGRIVFQPEGALAPDGLYLLDSPQRE